MKHLLPLVTLGAALCSCTGRTNLPPISAADSAAAIQDNQTHRKDVDEFFTHDPGSPFLRDTSIRYDGIRWFPIDPAFRVTSLLHRYANPETVAVMGTRGETRRNLKYGYFEFLLPGQDGKAVPCRLNVYKFTPYDGQRYFLYRDQLSVWFTDATTGHETYPVGRYVDVGLEFPDRGHRYVIDLNKAYNPYCAYSSMYSCAIPREEDHLPVAVRAGEMTYHK
jgi:uncharacterized protein (DUF1684 family)